MKNQCFHRTICPGQDDCGKSLGCPNTIMLWKTNNVALCESYVIFLTVADLFFAACLKQKRQNLMSDLSNSNTRFFKNSNSYLSLSRSHILCAASLRILSFQLKSFFWAVFEVMPAFEYLLGKGILWNIWDPLGISQCCSYTF